MKYDCLDPNCEYCRLTKKPMSQIIPLLPKEYQDLIDRNGGYAHFRDLVLLENSRTYNGQQFRAIRQRIRIREVNKMRDRRRRELIL